MKKKKQIAGLFKDTLKKVSMWFIYIFIDPSAQLPAAIMRKRKNQMYWLSKIDKFNTYYNFNQMVDIIREGIRDKYKLTPAQVLTVMYHIGSNYTIAGIGEATPTYTGAHFDGTNWVDDATGTIFNDEQYAAANEMAAKMETTSGTSSTFWSDLKEVIEWIVSLLNSLGLKVRSSSLSTDTADISDWGSDGTTSASLTQALPYVVGGAILFTLLSGKPKKKQATT